PFAGTAVAGIDVGRTTGNQAEFDGAAHLNLLPDAVALQKPAELHTGAVGAADCHRDGTGIDGTDVNRPAAVPSGLHEGGARPGSRIERIRGRHIDGTEHWAA